MLVLLSRELFHFGSYIHFHSARLIMLVPRLLKVLQRDKVKSSQPQGNFGNWVIRLVSGVLGVGGVVVAKTRPENSN